MLVLSRMRNESILIGDSIEILVIDSWNGKVRLGIKAPADIPISRTELLISPEIARQHGLAPGGVPDQRSA